MLIYKLMPSFKNRSNYSSAMLQSLQSRIGKFHNFSNFVINCRLNTIVNSDRIVILEKGEVVEFDSPRTLFKVGTISRIFNNLLLEKRLILSKFG